MQIINQGLDLNLVYGCTRDKTLMVELEACEVSNRDVEAALRLAHQEAVKYIEPQIRLAKKVGRQKTDYKLFMITDQNRRKIENKVKRLAEPQIETALFSSTSSGDDPGYSIYSNISKREQVMDEIKRNVEEVVLREDDVDEVVLQADACRQDLAEISFQKKIVRNAVNSVMRNVVGRRIIEKGLRVDGRPLDKIRKPQFCGCGALPVLYGSSIFCIGHTPVLCRVDLGNNESSSSSSSSLYDEEYAYSDYDRRHKFVFHRGSAKKAFLGVLPPEDDFPYNVKATVIIETAKSYGDVISTNYMASICGASLALMDAGIPLKRHVAGVFMGLISDVDPSTGAINNYRILTDMDGYDLELGDMNLKVAGTWKGITGIELDIKNPPVVTAEAGLQIGIGIGIPLDIICECLKPASKGLLQVLEHMEREIDAPRHSSHSFNQNGWNWRTLDDCSYFSSLKGKSYSLDSLRSLQQLGGPYRAMTV